MTDSTPFQITEKDFCDQINDLVKRTDISYMDAIIKWSEDNEVEIEYAASLITKNLALKSKLQEEAEQLHFIKKTVRLPV